MIVFHQFKNKLEVASRAPLHFGRGLIGEALHIARAWWRAPDMVDGAPDGDKEGRELWARVAISDRETILLGIGLLVQLPIYFAFLWLILVCLQYRAGFFDIFPVAMVLIAGAVGGLLHALMSFSIHIARRDFSRSWLWWYVSRPFHGAITAFAVYFVLRMTGAIKEESDILVTLIGTGVLAGLFSEQAVEKLSQIANTALAPGRPKEASEPAKKPVITKIKGSGENEFDPATRSLVIEGENFAEKATVMVDAVSQPKVTRNSATQLTLTLADETVKALPTANELTIVVENPDKQKSAPFKIKRKAA